MTSETGSPHATAVAFIDAIVWGEHHRVWELLGPEAREHALATAARRGMDAVAAARARQGTWGVEESDRFLSALVRGLRVDLAGTDINTVEVVDDPELGVDGAIRFRLETATLLPHEITGGAKWAAGGVIVAEAEGRWLVRRLEPRPPAGPATAKPS